MKRLARFSTQYLALAFVLLPQFGFAQESIRLTVATSLYDSTFSRIKEPFEKESGIKLVFNNTGQFRELSFRDVISGATDAAAASTTYSDWVKLMETKKLPIPPDADITHRIIGHDLMAVIANEESGVKSLTREQVVDLLSGKAKTWKDVGGKDIPVTLYFSKDKGNRKNGVQSQLLKGKDYTSKIQELDDEPKMFKALAADAGGIAVVATKPAVAKLRAIETPPLGRPATLITKGRPSPALEKLILFIRKNPNLIAQE